MKNKRKSAGKRFRREKLQVRAWEKQECKPCAKWLRNPTELAVHLAVCFNSILFYSILFYLFKCYMRNHNHIAPVERHRSA